MNQPPLIRTLWTMSKTSPGRSITAAIYSTETGRELRVRYGENADNLLDSLLSREGDHPLELRSDELRAVLLELGWGDEPLESASK